MAWSDTSSSFLSSNSLTSDETSDDESPRPEANHRHGHLHYLYTRELDTSMYMLSNHPEVDQADLRNSMDFDLVQLAKVWKLGERILMPVLQNVVMTELYSVTRSYDDASEDQLKKFVGFVSENPSSTVGNGKNVMRELVISIAAWSKYKGIMKWLPNDICAEAAERLKARYFKTGRKMVDHVLDFFVKIDNDG
ncbi:hypothetical protein ONS96_014731 [Cadophora gregata f. sp. sojae]|nr:hypothetical protein ONS96_014731 [Cadophora gregata f. sp. sojae]